MEHLEAQHVAQYLRGRYDLGPAAELRVTELSGGVSNAVYLIEPQQGPAVVLKQARARLRTPEPWFSSLDRIWREVEVLRACRRILDQAATAPSALVATTPTVLFEDRGNYCFLMTAAPPHSVWKAELLAGRTDPAIAAACGRLLGTLHAGSWQAADLRSSLSDRTLFDQLRLDPYYRTVARAHPDLAAPLARLIESVEDHPLCLVHADFSPKNLLVFDGGLLMVDFETGHFGDPAFDVGFFLSHLVLKATTFAANQAAYWELIDHFCAEYLPLVQPVAGDDWSGVRRRAWQNLAGCVLARLDGKSRIDYLANELRRDQLRRFCRQTLECRPETLDDVQRLLRTEGVTID